MKKVAAAASRGLATVAPSLDVGHPGPVREVRIVHLLRHPFAAATSAAVQGVVGMSQVKSQRRRQPMPQSTKKNGKQCCPRKPSSNLHALLSTIESCVYRGRGIHSDFFLTSGVSVGVHETNCAVPDAKFVFTTTSRRLGAKSRAIVTVHAHARTHRCSRPRSGASRVPRPRSLGAAHHTTRAWAGAHIAVWWVARGNQHCLGVRTCAGDSGQAC